MYQEREKMEKYIATAESSRFPAHAYDDNAKRVRKDLIKLLEDARPSDQSEPWWRHGHYGPADVANKTTPDYP